MPTTYGPASGRRGPAPYGCGDATVTTRRGDAR